MSLLELYTLNLHLQEQRAEEVEFSVAERETALQEQLARYRRLAEEGTAADRAKVAETLRALATLHRNEYWNGSEYGNEYERVLQECGEALGIYCTLAIENPQAYELEMAHTLCQMAEVHQYEEDEVALQELDEALILYRKWAGQKPTECNPHIADVLYTKAEIYLYLSRYEEADEKFQEVIDFCQTKHEEDTEYYEFCIGKTLYDWGWKYEWREQYEQAEEKFLALQALCKQRDNDDGTLALSALAWLYGKWQRYDLAEELYLNVLAIERKGMEQQPERYVTSLRLTLMNLADVHKRMQKYELAEAELREVLAIQRKWRDQDPDFRGVVGTLVDLAALHAVMLQFDTAEEELNEACLCHGDNEDDYDGRRIEVGLSVLQRIRAAMQYTEEELQRSREQAARQPQEGELHLARMLLNLATLHCYTQQPALAGLELDEAEELFGHRAEVEEEDIFALAVTSRLLQDESV